MNFADRAVLVLDNNVVLTIDDSQFDVLSEDEADIVDTALVSFIQSTFACSTLQLHSVNAQDSERSDIKHITTLYCVALERAFRIELYK